MREIKFTGGFSRSRPRLSTPAGVFSYLLDLLDVQHVRISLRQHARLRRHDLRRSDGTIPETKSSLLGRKLLLGALAPLAHGRIRGDYRAGRISVSEANTARIFSAPVLRRGGMRRNHRQAHS